MIGRQAAAVLSDRIGAKVSIGKINLGFLNRVIIDDLNILDQNHHHMLSASRLSAKADIVNILRGHISITSAQMFGLKANLYKMSADADPNFQFLLDSLKSKDTTSRKPLDLAVSSLVIRHGEISWNKMYMPEKYAKGHRMFSPDHVTISNLSGHINLNAIRDDSVNIELKALSMNEKSGLRLKDARFRLTAGKRKAVISNLSIEMPSTQISDGYVEAEYKTYLDSEGKRKIDNSSLKWRAGTDNMLVDFSDFAPLVSELQKTSLRLHMKIQAYGTASDVNVSRLRIVADDGSLAFGGSGRLDKHDAKYRWKAVIDGLTVSPVKLAEDCPAFDKVLTDIGKRLGRVNFTGRIAGEGNDISANGALRSEAGNLTLDFSRKGRVISANVKTPLFDLARAVQNTDLGNAATDISLEARMKDNRLSVGSVSSLKAAGKITRLDFRGYSYKNISLNAAYNDHSIIKGELDIDDPNAGINLTGEARLTDIPQYKVLADIGKLNLRNLKINNLWNGATLSGHINADVNGDNLHTLSGLVSVENLKVQSSDVDYRLDELRVSSQKEGNGRRVDVNSDFGTVSINGVFDYPGLYNSIAGIIKHHLPTLPGIKSTHVGNNKFAVNANITSTEWLRQLFGIDLTIDSPLSLIGYIDDPSHKMFVSCGLPSFTYNKGVYRNAVLSVLSPSDSLVASLKVDRLSDKGVPTNYAVDANACKNHLATSLFLDNNANNRIRGNVSTETQFFYGNNGKPTAHVTVHPSEIQVGDTLWNVQPSDILYSDNKLIVDHFEISHNQQHIIVSGVTSEQSSDSLLAELQDVDVSYILNLVNFHAVEFSGYASGQAWLSGLFGKMKADADLTVRDFRFEGGEMGILHARVGLDDDMQVNLRSIARDSVGMYTTINGYVSPKRNYIDLDIGAHNTRLDFVDGFCGAFMRNVDAKANGDVRVCGPLNDINLLGQLSAYGHVLLTPLNTVYRLENDTIEGLPGQIVFHADTLYDRDNNIGVLSGAINHHNLGNMTYDFDIKAQNLLAYDFRDYGDNTFYGTVYATGDCGIHGRSGTIDVDINITPERGSFIEYNAVSPNAVSDNDFIHWTSRVQGDSLRQPSDDDTPSIPSNMYLNFVINCTPEAELRVLMDANTGDKITLRGDGALRATYFNKGGLNIFGTYNVVGGTYRLTIQSIIQKVFNFESGGTITFGGDAMDAPLNLKADYVVNGVSLSDLQMGNSFANSNIRVDCIMDITGTPRSPKVDFSMNMPTVNSEARQMIYNVLNGEQQLNQQVLYLLAVGRFMPQGNNNASSDGTTTQQSQTSLAMQSLLSGQLSQQLNNVLGTVINNSNWNFGANISTGDEGWNNADYEGLVSGHMLNNRLQFNGQFGYRDNTNTANSNFIGDFDLRYLIVPTGNIALRVYNQTNDRYFTRNSLTTQGLGVIIKKDFNGLRDLFGSNRKRGLSGKTPLKKTSSKKSTKKEKK